MLPANLNTHTQQTSHIGSNKIHPINAQYLCSTLPHRIYEDSEGSQLELVVRPITQTVVETNASHGGIIGVYYQTVFAKFVNTLLLSNNGNISCINDYGYIEPYILDDDILYMLLNPVEINGWYFPASRTSENYQTRKDIGMNVSRVHPHRINEILESAILQTQEKCRFLLRA